MRPDDKILLRLDQGTISRLRNSSKQAQRLETKWDGKMAQILDEIEAEVMEALESDARIPDSLIAHKILHALEEHSFDVAMRAAHLAKSESEIDESAPTHRLAKRPEFPASIKSIVQRYEAWKKGKFHPKRPAKYAKKITDLYLKGLKDVWRHAADGFLSGETADKEAIQRKVADITDTGKVQAQEIVRTETTSYFNEGRREFYDESPDVTHYLFLAIRDKATSSWCTPKTVNGKRGRHGLVYAKGDPLLEKETPACHPYCRSEITPLTPENPSHLKLIQDKSIQRRNVQCSPLLKGWG